LKVAVFIDFDNIEIGVKSTLNRHFEVGTVLEAIKERGEVVTKVAYGDWKRAGEHSRSMTQHAIQMVQRNLTPGGDKNGADINLALDALEMAFTRNHINAFVIVGGDSDFIALVEKLKQYDKKVIVVGGRSFTSVILQKNCHEFIAYENLIQPQRDVRRPAERSRAVAAGDANLAKAFPLIRRALKVLSEREVSPQLGLLKSTLLQLDSTFSERDYSASTFRDFIEKMAAAGYVKLKQVDRSLLVELKDGEAPAIEETESVEREVQPPPEPVFKKETQPEYTQPMAAAPTGATPPQADELVRSLQDVFRGAKVTPHWPMYLRNLKQYIKNASPAFDEHRFGFVNFLEAVRAAQRGGVFRLERNRQGILRIFPGNQFPQQGRTPPMPDVEIEQEQEREREREREREQDREESLFLEPSPALEEATAMVEAEPIIEVTPEPMSEESAEAESIESSAEKPTRKRRAAAAGAGAGGPKKRVASRPRTTPARRPRKKPTEEPGNEA